MIKSVSIILPLYNEEKRLKNTFNKISKFLSNNNIKYKEIVFVDDGSTDDSSKLITSYIESKKKKKFIKLYLIKYQKNLGKGGALKAGVKKASGKWILTSDIDFSVPLNEVLNWDRKGYITKKSKVYFASRSHTNSTVNSKFYRKAMGSILRTLISFLLKIEIQDTQCGYKFYEKSVAKKVFSRMKSLKYEHDIEIILILKKMSLNIKELPVVWTHVPYSKVNIFSDSLKVLMSIFLLKKKYLK